MDRYLTAENFADQLKLECPYCLSFSTERLIREGTYRKSVISEKAKEAMQGEFPGHGLLKGPGFLTCIELKQFWYFAFDQYVERKWDKAVTNEYLVHICCLHNEAIRNFFCQAEKKIYYDLYCQGETDDIPVDSIEEIEQNLNADPNFYLTKCGQHNPIWDCYELEDVWETVMHNCMNTGKAIRDLIVTWASGLGLKKDLLLHMNQGLQAVQDLRMEGFKARSVKNESFGGCVAENYRAFLSISPWVFLFLKRNGFQKLAPGEKPDDGRPMDKWTIKHFKNYIYENRVRNIFFKDVIGGVTHQAKLKKLNLLKNKDQFRKIAEQVRVAVESKNYVTQFIPLESGMVNGRPRKVYGRAHFSDHPVLQGSELYELLPHLGRYFQVLMDTKLRGEKSKNRSEVCTMILLDQILQIYSRSEVDPCAHLHQKACLLGLLRSSSHLGKIPSLRSIHEGGDMGEGIVKYLRKMVPSGLRGLTWQVPLLTKFHTAQAMSFVNSFFSDVDTNFETRRLIHVQQTEDSEEETEDVSLDASLVRQNARKFRTYPSDLMFSEARAAERCLSMVAYSDKMSSTTRLGYVTINCQKEWIVRFVTTFGEVDDGLLYRDIISRDHTGFVACKSTLDLNQAKFKGAVIGVPHDQCGWYSFILDDGSQL